MNYKIYNNKNCIEIWIHENLNCEKIFFGEIELNKEKITEFYSGCVAFGYKLDIYNKYNYELIKPILNEKKINLHNIYMALEEYLNNRNDMFPVLALACDNVHLAEIIDIVDEKITNLTVNFVSILGAKCTKSHEVLIGNWCYNLINALFFKLGTRNNIEIWVNTNKNLFTDDFILGLENIASLQPKIADYCALLIFTISKN